MDTTGPPFSCVQIFGFGVARTRVVGNLLYAGNTKRNSPANASIQRVSGNQYPLYQESVHREQRYFQWIQAVRCQDADTHDAVQHRIFAHPAADGRACNRLVWDRYIKSWRKEHIHSFFAQLAHAPGNWVYALSPGMAHHKRSPALDLFNNAFLHQGLDGSPYG